MSQTGMISLSPDIIAYARKELNIKQYFQEAEEVTANHILWKKLVEGTKWKGLPKLIFYIIMNEEYHPPFEKDENDDLGYKLKLIAKES